MKLYLQFITVFDHYGNESEPLLHYWDENVKQWIEVESVDVHQDCYNEAIQQPPEG